MNYSEWLRRKDLELFNQWDKIENENFKSVVNLVFEMGWDEATEQKSIPEGYYKLGEKVEVRLDKNSQYFEGVVSVVWEEFFSTCITTDSENVQHFPSWVPVKGQTVLAKNRAGKAFYAVSAGGNKIYTPEGVVEAYDVKPFKPDCDEKLWEEV